MKPDKKPIPPWAAPHKQANKMICRACGTEWSNRKTIPCPETAQCQGIVRRRELHALGLRHIDATKARILKAVGVTPEEHQTLVMVRYRSDGDRTVTETFLDTQLWVPEEAADSVNALNGLPLSAYAREHYVRTLLTDVDLRHAVQSARALGLNVISVLTAPSEGLKLRPIGPSQRT